MNKSKDTIGEQVMIIVRSLTFRHHRMDWKMRMKARRKDVTNCDMNPVIWDTLAMLLQSQEGKTRIKIPRNMQAELVDGQCFESVCVCA